MAAKATDRRVFLKAGIGAAASLLPLQGWSRGFSGFEQKDRPNIVMFLSDDHSKLFTGCYGDSKVRTPNIDLLAGEGMKFENAFTPTAMCVPSRCSLYTGLYPVRHGAHHNHSSMYEDTRTLPHYLAESGYVVAVAGKRHINPVHLFPVKHIPKISSSSIDKFLRENREQRFCLMVTPSDPHAPWDKNDSYKPEDVDIPPYMLDTPATRKWMARYYGEISRADRMLGECNRLLSAHGLTDNTVFIYASDHGGQWPHSKWNLYDAGINVPFIVRWPGRIKAGSSSRDLISFVDFVPTCIELAGGRLPQNLDGKSMADVLMGNSARHHNEVYGITSSDYNFGKMFNEYPSRSLRTDTHLYIRNLLPDTEYTSHITKGPFYAPAPREYWPEWLARAESDEKASALVREYLHRPEEELYDLQSDPHQLHNVAAEPVNRELLKLMRSNLDVWMDEQGDKGMPTEIEGKKRIMILPNYW